MSDRGEARSASNEYMGNSSCRPVAYLVSNSNCSPVQRSSLRKVCLETQALRRYSAETTLSHILGI